MKARTYEDLPCPENPEGGSHSMQTKKAGTKKREPVTVTSCRHCGKASGVLNAQARLAGLVFL